MRGFIASLNTLIGCFVFGSSCRPEHPLEWYSVGFESRWGRQTDGVKSQDLGDSFDRLQASCKGTAPIIRAPQLRNQLRHITASRDDFRMATNLAFESKEATALQSAG